MGSRSRNTEVLERRVPWVSFGLVVLCVIGFGYAKMRSIEIDAVVDPQLAVAAEHFRQHPYLVMPSFLEAQIESGTAIQMRQEYFADLERRGAGQKPAGVRLREQAELDRMTRKVARKLKGRAEFQLGVVSAERNPLTFFSHIFFHGGIAHLAIGMLILLSLGRSLEQAWGPAVLLCAVTAGVLGSVGAFLMHAPEQTDPLIGTSGVLAAFVAAFALRFLGSQRSVAYWPLLILSVIGLCLPPWIGADWSIARNLGSAPPLVGGWNLSMWALLGGFGAGLGIALLVRMLGIEGLIEREEVAAELRRSGVDAEVELALQESSRGAPEQAFRRLTEFLRREPNNHGAAMAFWNVCDALDQHSTAAPYLMRAVREAVRTDDSETALFGWLELERCELLDGAEPALLLRMFAVLRDAGHEASAVHTLRQALLRAADLGEASVASRVARAAADLDPETAADAAWQALGSLEIDLEERQALEALLASMARDFRVEREGELSLEMPVTDAAVQPDSVTLDVEAEGDGVAMLGFNRELELVTGVPLKIDDTGLLIAVGESRKRVCFELIDAVAVAAVEGLSDKPVILIDLIFNWGSTGEEPLRVLRLRTDAFDPRPLVMGERDPLAAVRELSVLLMNETHGIPLPDESSIRGEPFAAFKSVGDYARAVLLVDLDERPDE